MAKALSSFNGRTNFLGLSKSDPGRGRPPFSYRPSVIFMAHKNPYVAKIEADIITHLKKTIPIKSPIEVYEPMRYFALAAPRTEAPALCIAACELVGGDRHQLSMATAAAIHLVHAAACTHQHFPSTAPNPPIQQKFKPFIELLARGGLVLFGLEMLTKSTMDSAHKHNADRILRVIVEITQAAGCQGMIEGQFRELGMRDSETDVELVLHVCQKKEGQLYACAAACGAILGGGSEEVIESLRKYGLYAGTVQGLIHGAGSNIDGIEETVKKSFMVKNLRALAMEELEIFLNTKIETIGSFLKT